MKIRLLPLTNNEKGFSLLELLIAGSITGGILLFSFDISRQINNQIAKLDENSDIVLDRADALKRVNDDVLNSVPSFNFLKSQNSNSQNKDFWTMTEANDGSRVIESKKDGDCFQVLTLDLTKTINPTTNLMSTVKSLLPTPGYFYTPRRSMARPLVYDKGIFNKLLKDNQLATVGQLIKISGMSPIFSANFYADYGMILKIDPVKEAIVDTRTVPVYNSPTNCIGGNKSIDQFLRCLPAPGGGVVNFYITPVSYVSYCLKTITGLKGLGLYRKRGEVEILVASRVTNITLKRADSSNALVNIDVGFCEVNVTNPLCL